MTKLALHEAHETLGARFGEVNGCEVVEIYGDPAVEHAAFGTASGVVDLGFRSRLCLTGADRARFLHGQVTNDVKGLQPGQGRYAALVTAKGKLESDLNILCLRDELLLDFEPGFAEAVRQRLERFLVADDVQVVDVAPQYGMLAILGPKSPEVVARIAGGIPLPVSVLASAILPDPKYGERILANHPRGATAGFDLFVPNAMLPEMLDQLMTAAKHVGGCPCGWRALEMIRIEAGLPRFGVDMDETNLAPETGIESKAISYEKGCYIGQEVINKLRTFAHVTKFLRGLRLADHLDSLPVRGDKLVHEGREIGHVTSALASPSLRRNIALGYVRREFSNPGTVLTLRAAGIESTAEIVALPFSR